jgi:hypothetical protein
LVWVRLIRHTKTYLLAKRGREKPQGKIRGEVLAV